MLTKEAIFAAASFLNLREREAKVILGFDNYKALVYNLYNEPDKHISYRWADGIVYLVMDGKDILQKPCHFTPIPNSDNILNFLVQGIMDMGSAFGWKAVQ